MNRTAFANRPVFRWRWLLTSTLALGVLYVFFASAGRFTEWNFETGYYDLFADGLRSGHLHLSVEPSSELINKSDPYDVANTDLWLWDIALYKNHYYLYWGPVPGLVLAAVKTVFRMDRAVGDQYLVTPFLLARAIAGAALLFSMARHYGARARGWSTLLAVAVFALANPIPFFLARSAVYEVSIAAGQFFAVLGMFFAFRGVSSDSSELGRKWLILAGVAWALCIGSRFSLVAAVGLLILWTAFVRWRIDARIAETGSSCARAILPLLYVGTPVGLGLLLQGAYNYVRFDSWTQVGIDYQLTWGKVSWHKEYIVTNLYAYLSRPFKTSCGFPFVYAPQPDWGDELPKWIGLAPSGYSWHEAITGILLAAPYSCFAAIVLLWILTVPARLLRNRILAERLPCNWPVVFGMGAALVLATAPSLALLGLFLPSMRYQADFSSGFMILATIGCWLWVHRAKQPVVRALGVGSCVLLSTATLGIGLLMGFDGYYHRFKTFNPALYSKLESLRICEDNKVDSTSSSPSP